MDMSGLRQNDTMERSYNRNNGRIVGRQAIISDDEYKKYRDMAERAAKALRRMRNARHKV